MTKPTATSVYIPADLKTKIDSYARFRNLPRSETICYLVELALNFLAEKDSRGAKQPERPGTPE